MKYSLYYVFKLVAEKEEPKCGTLFHRIWPTYSKKSSIFSGKCCLLEIMGTLFFSFFLGTTHLQIFIPYCTKPVPSQTHSDSPHENITCLVNEWLYWWSSSPVVTCFSPLGSATVAHHFSSSTNHEGVQLNAVPNVQLHANIRKCDSEVVSCSVFSHFIPLKGHYSPSENVHLKESFSLFICEFP